jgi:cell division protein FtsI (penicillin-binding protein 3)
MTARRRIGGRLAITIMAVFALVAVFVVRLVDIQVVQAESLTKAAMSRQELQTTVFGSRGEIVDTNGVVLADSVDRFDITASPKTAKLDGYSFERTDKDGQKKTVSLQDSVAAIAAITNADPQKMYQAIIGDPTADFAYLVKSVPLAQFQKVKALGIPWVYFQTDPARSYPNGAVAANLIGYMGTDGPLAGVEASENSCLAASNGTQTYQSSANGVPIPGSTITTKPAVNGGTIRLTIDSDLNWFAQQTLSQQVQATGSEWGTAMVVRVSDGHIMADADYGNGDLNALTGDKNQLNTRSFTNYYEPGSVMKPATVAGLIQAGKITPSTPVDVPSRFTDGLPKGVTITDSFYHGDLHLTAAGVIMDSSNIGIAELTKLDSYQNRTANLAKFGFGQKTAVGFPNESAGILRTNADIVTQTTQQFGQGMTATSAQVAQLYQTLGNDGTRMPLTLVEGCTKPDGTVVDTPSTQGVPVVSPSTAQQVRSMMETVYQEGPSSQFLQIPGYNIAAKTGTAQVADPATGKYAKGQYIVSVAGLVPADKPQYAVVFTLAKPQGITSSVAAAPGWKALMSQVIKSYRVPASTGAPSLPPVTW